MAGDIGTDVPYGAMRHPVLAESPRTNSPRIVLRASRSPVLKSRHGAGHGPLVSAYRCSRYNAQSAYARPTPCPVLMWRSGLSRYGMSGNDVGCGTICCVMCGTARVIICDARVSCYAMRGTEVAYDGTRCTVLKKGMAELGGIKGATTAFV
eukprot:3307513-Rhodomonas_salina.1